MPNVSFLALFRDLRREAIRLCSQPEHYHELSVQDRFSFAPADDRRHADAQARAADTGCLHPAVRKFARYLNRVPDTATAEDLRNFQLHLVDHGASPITLNATITGLKFFFGVTLDRGATMAKMQHVFVPRT